MKSSIPPTPAGYEKSTNPVVGLVDLDFELENGSPSGFLNISINYFHIIQDIYFILPLIFNVK